MKLEELRASLTDLKAGELSAHLQHVDDISLKAFWDTLEFKNGRLAHADYRTLLGKITEKGLVALFGKLGVPADRFARIRDTDCVSSICFVYPGRVCDPDYCPS